MVVGLWGYFWDVSAGNATAVDNWEEITSWQVPQKIEYFGTWMADASYGDWTESLPPLYSATDTILMDYKDFAIPPSLMTDQGFEWTNYIVPVVGGIVDYTWDIDLDSRPWADYYKDHLSEEKSEYFIASIAYDIDTENQLLQLPYQVDKDLLDTGVELVQPAKAFDTDAENQKLQDSYNIDRALSDESLETLPTVVISTDSTLIGYRGYGIPSALKDHGTEWINYIVPVIGVIVDFTWDEDSNSRLWVDTAKDHLSEEKSEYFIAPIVYDTDAENQIQQLSYQLDRELAEANVEFFIAPIVYDTDAENQLFQSIFSFDRDILDTLVELVQPAKAFDGDGDNQLFWLPCPLDREVSDPSIELVQAAGFYDNDTENQRLQDGYNTDRHLSDENVEQITLPPIVSTFTWDDIAEQQIPTPLYYKDHLLDEGIEYVQAASAYDTDVENQFQQLNYQLDIDVMDPSTESPLVPAILDYTWDEDSNSKQWVDFYKDHLTEENVEFFITPIVYDTDAENQIQQLPYTTDKDVTDSSVELIQSASALDTDAENQLFQLPYQLDREVADTGIELVEVAYFFDNDADTRQWMDTAKDHLSEECIEFFEAPQAYDTDGENQLAQLVYQLDRELADTGVEALQRMLAATDVILMDYKGYVVSKSFMILDDERLELVQAAEAFDTDAENQKLQDGYNADRHLSDEAIENITIVSGWDTDAENQIQQLPYQVDNDPEQNIAYFIVPAPVVGQDDDANNQLQWILNFGSDTLSDETVEEITLPPYIGDVDIVIDDPEES